MKRSSATCRRGAGSACPPNYPHADRAERGGWLARCLDGAERGERGWVRGRRRGESSLPSRHWILGGEREPLSDPEKGDVEGAGSERGRDGSRRIWPEEVAPAPQGCRHEDACCRIPPGGGGGGWWRTGEEGRAGEEAEGAATGGAREEARVGRWRTGEEGRGGRRRVGEEGRAGRRRGAVAAGTTGEEGRGGRRGAKISPTLVMSPTLPNTISTTSGAITSSMTSLPITSLGHAITVRLTRENFFLWKAQVLPVLRAQQLFGYVYGSICAPSQFIIEGSGFDARQVPNPEYLRWYTHDQIVLSALSPL
ncbi:hypothetical protein PR202_gb03491 [Eleusine coracana subsp. coracana]|uniref:Retrotransposon Copia-like N-terminal domain-containing protein n=1 Tax=Eleusine coracana subsp. coracana TaxID=191504 RepID=A0AAV5E1X9_ELECO|nr:hypothetical protein PR202_gb03491 [Eleusine coracana subsp. coracana]